MRPLVVIAAIIVAIWLLGHLLHFVFGVLAFLFHILVGLAVCVLVFEGIRYLVSKPRV